MLSPEIKRIHLQFAPKINGGHNGARKFWREYLPRMKYHNPGVSMTVDRSESQSGDSLMTIFYAPPTSSSPSDSAQIPSSPTSSTTSDPATLNPASFNRVETIDMKEVRSHAILERFMNLIKPTQVLATKAEKQELRELEEAREKAAVERTREAARVAKIRRDEELLQKAREASVT